MPASFAIKTKPRVPKVRSLAKDRSEPSDAVSSPQSSSPTACEYSRSEVSRRADTVRMVTIEVRLIQNAASGEWAAQAATTGAALPRTFTYNRRRTREEALQDRELVAAWLRSELPRFSVADDSARVVFLD